MVVSRVSKNFHADDAHICSNGSWYGVVAMSHIQVVAGIDAHQQSIQYALAIPLDSVYKGSGIPVASNPDMLDQFLFLGIASGSIGTLAQIQHGG